MRQARDAIESYLEAEAEQGFDLMLDLADLPHVVLGEIEAELSPSVIKRAREGAKYLERETAPSGVQSVAGPRPTVE